MQAMKDEDTGKFYHLSCAPKLEEGLERTDVDGVVCEGCSMLIEGDEATTLDPEEEEEEEEKC